VSSGSTPNSSARIARVAAAAAARPMAAPERHLPGRAREHPRRMRRGFCRQ
jgi:hypothetical protein